MGFPLTKTFLISITFSCKISIDFDWFYFSLFWREREMQLLYCTTSPKHTTKYSTTTRIFLSHIHTPYILIMMLLYQRCFVLSFLLKYQIYFFALLLYQTRLSVNVVANVKSSLGKENSSHLHFDANLWHWWSKIVIVKNEYCWFHFQNSYCSWVLQKRCRREWKQTFRTISFNVEHGCWFKIGGTMKCIKTLFQNVHSWTILQTMSSTYLAVKVLV